MRKLVWALVGLLMSCSALAEINLKELSEAPWTRFESKNFVVVTDAPGRRGKQMLSDLERFHLFMFSQFGDWLSPTGKPMPLVLVDNYEVYSALGLPKGYSGIFIHSKRGSAVLADARGFTPSSKGRPSWGRSVVFHELVHYYLQNSAFKSAAEPWIDEGLAEYFSTYVENRRRILLGDPATVLKRVEFMLDLDPESETISEDVIASESLLKTGRKSLQVAASSSTKREQFLSRFYGRSLAVVHFLSADPQRRDQFRRYLGLTAEGVGVDRAFAEAFGTSFRQFDREVAHYFQEGELKPVSVRLPSRLRSRLSIERQNLSDREAIEFLVPKLTALPETVLGDGGHAKLASQVRLLYPDWHRS